MMAFNRKSLLILLLTVMSTILTSCIKPQFKIIFDLDKNVNTPFNLVYYASSRKQGFFLEQEVFITDGKAELIGITSYPTIVYVCRGGTTPSIAFYAEKGDKIKIMGEDANPETWLIDGNKINREWSDWRIANKEILMRNNPADVNAAVAKYVKNNPDNLLSGLLLATTFYRSHDESMFKQLWYSLKEDLRSDKYLNLYARPDLDDVPVKKEPLTDVMLRTKDNGAEMLRFKGARASMLLFRHINRYDGQTGIDTLKNLARSFPDSATRNIVDIMLEPDSLSWISNIRFDSISGIVRAWMPLGITDPWVMKVQPTTTPSFIVTDNKGNVVYAGSDSYKASQKFRKLMQTPQKKNAPATSQNK